MDIQPKILYLDIERSLMTFYGYERRVNGGFISKDLIKDEAFIICWSAGWVGETKLFSACVTQREALRKDDKRVLRQLWDLIDQADLVTGHNVDNFDMKKLNNRFLIHGMGLPLASWKKSVDTLKLARKHFPFDSNSLEYISVRLGGKPKKDIRLDDWKKIVDTGDPKTLRKAETYCRGDVREGLGVFYKLVNAIETSGRIVYR